MVSRHSILIVTAVIATAVGLSPASAASPQPFNAQAFADAQKAGKPILIAIHASWCPTCKAQAPILDHDRCRSKIPDHLSQLRIVEDGGYAGRRLSDFL